MDGDAPCIEATRDDGMAAVVAPPRRLAWGLEALGIDALWRMGLTGAGVLAGHLDTGVAGEHPALAGRVAAFLELDGEGRPVPAPAPRDTASHGTHTAGVLCGGSIEGETIGVAPGARLCSAAVIDGGKNVVRILRGLDWLSGSGVRVLCLPLGVPDPNPIFSTMIEALHAEGVLTVAAIGNAGSAWPHAPATYPGVLAVGAVGRDLRLASYTGACPAAGKPEVLAPGAFIRSAHPRLAGAAARGGTSQASAFVAGVACLLFQAFPTATPAQVAGALIQSAAPVGDDRGQRYGAGLIRPLEALEQLARSPDAGALPAPAEAPFFRDPALLAARRAASPDARLSCVVVASGDAPSCSVRGAAGPLVDRITRDLGEPAEQEEYLKRGRIAFLTASPRLVDALARDPDVSMLGAATAQNAHGLW